MRSEFFAGRRTLSQDFFVGRWAQVRVRASAQVRRPWDASRSSSHSRRRRRQRRRCFAGKHAQATQARCRVGFGEIRRAWTTFTFEAGGQRIRLRISRFIALSCVKELIFGWGSRFFNTTDLVTDYAYIRERDSSIDCLWINELISCYVFSRSLYAALDTTLFLRYVRR